MASDSGLLWTPGCATPSTPWGTVAARRWLRNSGDADPAEDLLAEDLPEPVPEGNDDTDGDGRGDSGGGQCGGVASVVNDPEDAAADADTESVAARLAIRTPCATACADSRNTPADPFSGRGMSPNCVWRSKYTAV